MKHLALLAACLMTAACGMYEQHDREYSKGQDPHKQVMGETSAYPAHGIGSWRCSPGTVTRGCTHPALNPPKERMEQQQAHADMMRQNEQYRQQYQQQRRTY